MLAKNPEETPVLSLPAILTSVQALDAQLSLTAQIATQTSVVVDASALTQFDSSTLAVLLACRRQAIIAGKTFAVHGLPDKLAQLAGLYGVAELMASAA